MTRLTTLGGLVMGILACQPGVSGEAPATGSPEPARARSAAADPAEDGSAGQGAARPVSAVGEQDARPTGGDPTLARIDAFLRYQERRLTLEAALWTELEAAIPKPRRGGRARSVVQAPSRASLELLERRAEEDEAALAAVGLSRPELAELGALVREVLGPRRLARELALEETAELLEEQAERLTGSQREELAAQAAPLRARLDELMALEQVRAERGDAAVDAVLAREEALLKWEQARLAALAGR